MLASLILEPGQRILEAGQRILEAGQRILEPGQRILEAGQRILEAGTGAGWNAGLLAARAGAGLVTTVEVDVDLAAAADRRLAAAGLDVAVHARDGNAGLPAQEPYDGVIATYTVDELPWTWIEQTRPGGRPVIPWGRLGHVALTVADDG
ncbi:methyltransferase domain-containing protein [Streptomyces sp. NPDC059385]|uniref:methyltransferase domain-containing protein n=1 Tax=Streptomyces sp. NPDC059385 TaxID=3346817 RepID=UPI0036CF3B97